MICTCVQIKWNCSTEHVHKRFPEGWQVQPTAVSILVFNLLCPSVSLLAPPEIGGLPGGPCWASRPRGSRSPLCFLCTFSEIPLFLTSCSHAHSFPDSWGLVSWAFSYCPRLLLLFSHGGKESIGENRWTLVTDSVVCWPSIKCLSPFLLLTEPQFCSGWPSETLTCLCGQWDGRANCLVRLLGICSL